MGVDFVTTALGLDAPCRFADCHHDAPHVGRSCSANGRAFSIGGSDNLAIRSQTAHHAAARARQGKKMSSIRSIIRHAAGTALLASIAIAIAGPAHAVSIDVGSYTNTGLGAEFATSYDTFTITGNKIDIAMPRMPAEISLGTFWFEVGPNCHSCALTPSFDAILDVKVHGQTQQLHIPYAWRSSGPNDYLSFSQAAPLMFDFGNQGMLMIALDTIATLSSAGGKVYGDLYATASLAPAPVTPVPEPASYALMLAGFSLVAYVARRRRG
jgi:hypothetical protein